MVISVSDEETEKEISILVNLIVAVYKVTNQKLNNVA